MKSNQTEKAERLFTALGDLDPKTVASATAYIPILISFILTQQIGLTE